MKRVCTLRKVLRSLSKVLLEKLFYRSYISWLLSPLSSYCFCDISSQEIFHVATLLSRLEIIGPEKAWI